MKKIILLIFILNFSFAISGPGDLDDNFGNKGKIITNINGYNNYARSIATTGNGSTLLAGSSESGTISNITVSKYDYDGKLDLFFGLNGIVNINFNKRLTINAIASNSNDQSFVVGSIQNGIFTDFLILKLNRNGVIDSTFGTNGYVTLDFQSNDDVAYGIALYSDGRMIVVGRSNNGFNDDVIITRLLANGSKDITFADNGQLIQALSTGLTATSESAYGVAIQTNGKIVVCGYTQIALRNMFLIIRTTSNGTLDSKFGENEDGIVKMTIGATNDVAYGLNILDDERIVVYGTSYKGLNPKFALLRLLSYGRIDPDLNGVGKVVADYGKANSTGRSAYLQMDNSLIIVGENYADGGKKEFGIARIYNDGTFDETFGINGKISTTFTANDNSAYAIGFISSGQIVVGGETFNGSDYDFALARFYIAKKPTVRTKIPFEILSLTAFAGGSIVNDGAATIKVSGLVWDTLDTPDIFTNAGLTNVGTKTGTFYNQMTKLKPGTKYYVRAYATNSIGTSYGLPEEFTTLAGASVKTNPITNVKKTTADGGGEITSDGGVPVLKRGIVWDTISLPTITRKIGITDDGDGIGKFSSQLTGLNLKTTYYVRAYATNSITTNYGNEATFTSPDFPKVVTLQLVTIDDITFIAGGNILSDGGATISKRGVVYSNVSNPSFSNRIGLIYMGTGNGSFSSTISGFFPDSTYYLKAFATNEAGTTFGQEISFKIYNGPSVITFPVTDIDSKSAQSGGNILQGGSFNVTQRGVLWSLFANPSLNTFNGFTIDGSGSGTFSSKVAIIDPESFYYLRAYSIYNLVPGYGKEFRFWSLSMEPKSYPAIYNIGKTADFQLTLTFNPPKTIEDCDGYLITQSINTLPDFIPKDANSYQKGDIFNSTKILDIISNIDADNIVINGLILDSNYYYNIIPYNYNGSVSETMNYKTDGNIPLLYRQMTTNVNENLENKIDINIDYSNDILSFKSNQTIQGCKISVSNEIGKEVLNSVFENNSSEFIINVSKEINSGVYFVKFESSNNIFFKKFTYLK